MNRFRRTRSSLPIVPTFFAVLLGCLALTLSACGSDSGSSGSGSSGGSGSSSDSGSQSGSGGGSTSAAAKGPGGTIKVEADPNQLLFTTGDLTVKEGDVTIDFTNPASISHDVRIADEAGTEIGGTDLVSGGSATATVNLAPGTYTYFCSVSNHRAAGMEGKLTVK